MRSRWHWRTTTTSRLIATISISRIPTSARQSGFDSARRWRNGVAEHVGRHLADAERQWCPWHGERCYGWLGRCGDRAPTAQVRCPKIAIRSWAVPSNSTGRSRRRPAPSLPRSFTNTDSYNFTYTQGFVTGTALNLGWNNSRTTTTNFFSSYSPEILSSFNAKVTQHLLQGAGIWVNNRFVYEAILDRRITDSTFRQQILATVNQVENIYWVVVSAYEDVQAKEHALDQSTKLDSDTRKQLEIGTMAPLDVVNADSTVATDKQALITSQSNLNYQQLIIKQAIARNLNDAALVAAPIIPTDRVSLDPLPEEKQTPDELAQVAFKNRPELEQAVLSIKKDEITLRGARNSLLPSFDVYGYYGAQGIGGNFNPASCALSVAFGIPCTPFAPSGYSDALGNLVNGSSPDKGVGFTFQIPIRNRPAQADQARSLIEYRQAEMHLEQLYTQIRMQVVSAAVCSDQRSRAGASSLAARTTPARVWTPNRRS